MRHKALALLNQKNAFQTWLRGMPFHLVRARHEVLISRDSDCCGFALSLTINSKICISILG
jgi:hypothetical protein